MRSIAGPFLATLGATGAAVGIVGGAGELAGYALRLFSGYLADRTRGYWPLVFAGYLVNLAAVPLLAFASSWPVAGGLILAERTGKAIRGPARDVLLSYASHRVGRGWAFGLHGAMDQIGAVAGPLLLAGILARFSSYRDAFLSLAVPAVLALATLSLAARTYPHPAQLEAEPAVQPNSTGGLGAAYWTLVAGAALLAFGFTDFALVAFHWKKTALLADAAIPVLYAVAMAADGAGSLLLGWALDRPRGIRWLPVAALVSLTAPVLMFGAAHAAWAGVGLTLWAAGLGAAQTGVKATIARLIPKQRRGQAYGWYNALYGAAWFAGSALMGLLYDRSIAALIALAITAQLCAVPLLWRAARKAEAA
jgi:MFS family permease